MNDHQQQRREAAEWRQAVRAAARDLTPVQRAALAREIVGGLYDSVKFDNPEGGGIDGRDGPERDGLGTLVAAAEDHYHAMLRRVHG